MRRLSAHVADADIDAGLAEINRLQAARGCRSDAGCGHCRSGRRRRDRRRPRSATRGVTPDAAATPSQRRKFRRSNRVLLLVNAAVNNAGLPGVSCSLACAIDAFASASASLACVDGGIEVAGGGRFLGRGQGLLRGSPLVLQRAGVLLGGFGGGERRIEIGLGARRLRRRIAAQNQTGHRNDTAMRTIVCSAVTAARPARRSAGRCSCRTDNTRRRDSARPAAAAARRAPGCCR